MTSHGEVEVFDGDLKYVGDKGGNTYEIAYQEASGAPVERQSPLGYAVGPVTIVFLNLSKMVGTGIFSTRKSSLPIHMYLTNLNQHPQSSPAQAPSASA